MSLIKEDINEVPELQLTWTVSISSPRDQLLRLLSGFKEKLTE